MMDFFTWLGIIVVVNAIGWIPVFLLTAINDWSMDESIENWHLIMTMVIATFISMLILDPSLFNLMWIE